MASLSGGEDKQQQRKKHSAAAAVQKHPAAGKRQPAVQTMVRHSGDSGDRLTVGAARNDIRRLSRRAGVKTIGGTQYGATHQRMHAFLTGVLRSTLLVTRHSRRSVVSTADVLYALQHHHGMRMYGLLTAEGQALHDEERHSREARRDTSAAAQKKSGDSVVRRGKAMSVPSPAAAAKKSNIAERLIAAASRTAAPQ